MEGTSAAEAASHECHCIAAPKALRHPKTRKCLPFSQFETDVAGPSLVRVVRCRCKERFWVAQRFSAAIQTVTKSTGFSRCGASSSTVRGHAELYRLKPLVMNVAVSQRRRRCATQRQENVCRIPSSKPGWLARPWSASLGAAVKSVFGWRSGLALRFKPSQNPPALAAAVPRQAQSEATQNCIG